MYQLLIKCVIIISIIIISEASSSTSLTSSSTISSSTIDTTLGFTTVSPENVVTLRNKPLLLNCSGFSATEYGSLRIAWRHNGHHIPIGDDHRQTLANGSLLIKRASIPKKRLNSLSLSSSSKRSDDGTYTCLLNNNVGTLMSKPINVIITRYPQSFSTEPESQTAAEGSSVRFTCQIESILPITYTWLQNGHKLPHDGAQSNDRYFEMQSHGVLQISNVTLSDGGNYQCIARLDVRPGDILSNFEVHSLSSSDAKLTVTNALSHTHLLELSPVFLSKSTHVIKKTKESVMIECFLSYNQPHTVVNWYRKSGKELPPDERRTIIGSNLVINDIRYEDHDIYVCNATMNDKNLTQENILTVHVRPEFRSRPQSKAKPAAQTARFYCAADGIPIPTIKWFKNGQQIYINGRIKMKNETINSLVISQLVVSDSGIYQCVAENSAGISIASARLLVNASSSQPDPPKHLKAKTLSSTSIMLSWNQSSSPSGLNIQAYTVHYLPSSGGVEMQKVAVNTSQVIDKLEPFTNYTFYVRAYNGRSASEQSNSIVHMTDEDVPIGVPIANLMSLSPTVLHVSWDELSPRIARGVITGHRIHYRKHNQPSYNVEELPSDARHCVIEGLMPKHKYDVRIMCRTKVGFPILSDTEWPWQMYEMPNDDNGNIEMHVPIPPTVHLTGINATAIEVRWSFPLLSLKDDDKSIIPHIEGVKLYYQQQNNPLKGPIVLNSDIRKYVLTNLKPHTWYEVQVLAFNSSGDSKRSSQNIMTLPLQSNSDQKIHNTSGHSEDTEDTHMTAPSGLEADPLSSTSIKLIWNSDLNKNIIYYSVRYYSVHLMHINNSSEAYNYIRSTNNDVVITDLMPFTVYGFSVRAHDIRNNHGPFSSNIECKTLEDIPSSPQDLTGMIVDAHSIRLSWIHPKTPNGIINSYIALYNTKYAENFESWSRREVKGSKLTTVIQNLSSNTQYYFCVRASTKAGFGPLSPCLTMTIPVRLINSTHRNNLLGQIHNDSIEVSDPILGIIIGLSIGIFCIIICVAIIIFRNRCCPSKLNSHRRSNGHSVHYRNGHLPSMYGDTSQSDKRHSSSDGEFKELDSFVTSGTIIAGEIHENHLDTKGGYSPIKRNGYFGANTSNGLKSAKKRYYDSNDKIEKKSSPLLESDNRKQFVSEVITNGSRTLPLTQNHQRTPKSQLELSTFVENCAPGRPSDQL